MTVFQYKNKIRSTLADKSLKGVESVEVARKLFKNCGIPLPQGSCKDILNTLKSDDFIGWRSCTQDEAQQYANEGIPAIGLTDKRIVVIEPEGDKSSINDVNLDENVISVSTASALLPEDSMVYFASTMSSTTTTPVEEHTIRVEGIPDGNKLVLGEGMTLRLYYDDMLTWPNWDYDPTMWYLYEEIIQHTTVSHFISLKPGTTTITARDGGLSYSFDITIKEMQIYISPANHEKPYYKLDGTPYPTSEWNEKKNMEIVADYLKSYLDNYYVNVHISDIHQNNSYTGRPADADEWITDKEHALYLALHSNADESSPSTATGSVAYYNHIGNLAPLALAFVDAIDAVVPTVSDRWQRTIAGDYAEETPAYLGNLGELKDPQDLNISSILIETGFHDNPSEADYLINNQSELAETIGGVLVYYYGLVEK